MSDFPSHVTPDGVKRALNLIPSPPAFRASKPLAGVLQDSEILDFDNWPSSVKIKDQGQYGACVGHSTATSIESERAFSGMSPIPLSAWYAYSILCGGIDRGASIADALTLITADGIAPETLVPYGTINPRKLTDGAHKAAPRFRAELAATMTGYEDAISEAALGRFVVLSIPVGDQFSNLDPEGVPPVYRGVANHAVCVGGGIKTSKKWGRLIRMANSWGARWGLDGFCWLSKAHIDNALYFEAYSVSAVYDDPQDPTNPPKVA